MRDSTTLTLAFGIAASCWSWTIMYRLCSPLVSIVAWIGKMFTRREVVSISILLSNWSVASKGELEPKPGNAGKRFGWSDAFAGMPAAHCSIHVLNSEIVFSVPNVKQMERLAREVIPAVG